jgi:hypothetical protein
MQRFLLLIKVTAVISTITVCSATLVAQTGEVDVPAQANIYGAGHSSPPAPAGGGGGILPTLASLTGGGFLSFQAVGQVSYNGGGNYYGADGGQYGASTAINSYGGISGIRHNSRVFFLVGTFLNNQEPIDPAPSILDATNDSFTQVSPSLDQVFFIGDGLTGTGIGSTQSIYIPTGATRLFLGFADGFDFTGPPGLYGDNVGTLHVGYTQTVPEPAVTASVLLLLLVALVRRRRHDGVSAY